MILGWLACSAIVPNLIEPTVPVDCAAVVSRVNAERPMQVVQMLAKEPRRSEARRSEVRALLRATLEPLGFVVQERPFEISGIKGVNLVVTGGGGGGLLLGAHYDTVASTPGADDNASGVAVVLEVAQALGKDAPATYVFFDAEEPYDARVGSDGRNFAFGSQAFVDAGGRWDLALIVESVGFSCQRAGCQTVPSGVPKSFPRDGNGVYWIVNRSDRDWGRDLATFRVASADHAAYVVAIPGKGHVLRQSRFSDHAPFWDAGMDAVMVTDTALLRNGNYHRGGDRPETLDGALLADVARGITAVVAAQLGHCTGHSTP